MSFNNKIDEWMKEAEERPESAAMIARLIARRLRELTERDEELLPEFEFYIFDSVSFENGINRSSYTIESREADWNSHDGGHEHYIPLHGGYHAIPPKDQLYRIRTRIMQNLENMGVSVKYHHHEVGGPGQCEIETPMMGLVQAGDATMIIKYVTNMTAHESGQTATFMPKPLFGEAGSGMHFHQHLFKQNKNVFYDPKGYG